MVSRVEQGCERTGGWWARGYWTVGAEYRLGQLVSEAETALGEDCAREGAWQGTRVSVRQGVRQSVRQSVRQGGGIQKQTTAATAQQSGEMQAGWGTVAVHECPSVRWGRV